MSSFLNASKSEKKITVCVQHVKLSFVIVRGKKLPLGGDKTKDTPAFI